MRVFVLVLLLLVLAAPAKPSGTSDWALPLVVDKDPARTRRLLEQADRRYRKEHIPVLLEVYRFAALPETRRGIVRLLQRKTGQPHTHLNDWYAWSWNRPERAPPDYADFKADLYAMVQPGFETYFRDRTASIRLDEIRWGGVAQDGIPPLRDPTMVPADEAPWLDDDHIVFGLAVGDDVRAYPKRILAWHEMFVDEVGGLPVAGVYCTLCGSMIPYVTEHAGTVHELGTSGFLYRSNKLMYDRATQSLWNTLRGEPVVGPLVGKGIRLRSLPVVTTTWGAWRRDHPTTTVLSLETGHDRNYDEGVAYRDYFATDALMFNTPFHDNRLANKEPVLALRFQGSPHDQLAITSRFLQAHPVHHEQVGAQSVVILTDSAGAHRVYDPGEIRFVGYAGQMVLDEAGETWTPTEHGLTHPDGRTRPRLAAHRAFWFGWHATWPETRLVK